MCQQVDRGVDDFAQVVGRDVGGHAHRDALAAVDEQVGESRGQHLRLFAAAVVGRLHVDGLFVDVGQQLHGQRMQPAFGVVVDEAAGEERVIVGVDPQ